MNHEQSHNEERVWVLIAKKKAGEADDAELAELEEIIAASKGRFSNELLDELWKAPLESLPEMNIGPASWKNIQNAINEPHGKIKWLATPAKKWMAAAALLITAGITYLWYYNQSAMPADKAIAATVNTITTQPASKTQLTLPDGTKVWLNANSQLEYATDKFGKGNREVRLKGEAFFDVVKNEQLPFIIHAGVVNITVKGTAFNVKAYPTQKHIETTLIRGLIEITTSQDPERKILVKPNEKIIVPAFIQPAGVEMADSTGIALYNITRFKKSQTDIIPETVWINSRLEFDNETLEELAPKMESWFSVSIHFKDGVIKQKRFSGLIEKETLTQTLQAMQLSYPFKYTIDGTDIYISK